MEFQKPPQPLLEQRPGITETTHPTTGPSLGKPPAQYTEAVKDKIVEYVKEGLGPSEAAVKAGITRPTYYNWKRKYLDGDIHLTSLFEAIEVAQVEHEYGLIQEVHKNDRFKNPLAVLEKLYGKRWSTKVTNLVNDELEETISKLQHEFINEPVVWNRILSCLAKE